MPDSDPRYGLGYALAAYAVFLVVFFGYVAHVHLRCARLRRRVEALQDRLGAEAASRPTTRS